jgi:hypothetical protein
MSMFNLRGYTTADIKSACHVRAEAGQDGIEFAQGRDELAGKMVGIVVEALDGMDDGAPVPSLYDLVDRAWASLVAVAAENRRLDTLHRQQFPAAR